MFELVQWWLCTMRVTRIDCGRVQQWKCKCNNAVINDINENNNIG